MRPLPLAVPLLALACLAALPAAAQDHGAHDHHAGHHGHAATTGDAPHPATPGHGDHAGHDPASPAGPPPRALGGPRHAADAIWGEAAMAPARKQLVREHGAMRTGAVMVERLEAQVVGGKDAIVWEARAWYGGDLSKLWLTFEGEGQLSGPVENAEVQILLSRAITPHFDLQAGMRADLEPQTRFHAVLGVTGLAPYMIETDAALFLSDRGDVTARIEAAYDQRITQRLILQPRVELALSAQAIPERELGAGLTSLEAGLRLRYEIRRELAPYIGLGYETALGRTADIIRARGGDTGGFSLLLGLRAWF